MVSNNKIINEIINFISNNNNLNKKFNHFKQKYTLEELLKPLIIIFKKGLSYRDISNYTTIHWNTIYKFHIKLVSLNIYQNLYDNIVSKYLNDIGNELKYFFVDSTMILNKNGSDNVSYNPQIKKHKTSKLSIIIDEFGVPINIKYGDSRQHDSKYFQEQIEILSKKHPKLLTEDKIFIGDTAYDSSITRKKLKELKLGKLICPKNKRNNKTNINNNYNQLDKVLLKKRVNVEHLINRYKQVKKLNIRYERKSIIFNNNIYLVSIMLVLDKI